MNTEPLARGAVASPAATAPASTQSLTLMLLCHLDIFDLGELSLWSISKLYHEPSFPWRLPCWWGGFCPLGLVSFHFQKPFSLDLVSSLLQNLPAACPTELSLFLFFKTCYYSAGGHSHAWKKGGPFSGRAPCTALGGLRGQGRNCRSVQFLSVTPCVCQWHLASFPETLLSQTGPV